MATPKESSRIWWHLANRLRPFTRHLVVMHGGAGTKVRREVMRRLVEIPPDEERLVLDTPPMSFSLGLSRTQWYSRILGGLEGVSQEGGTAPGLGARLQGIAGSQTRLFAKTGTLNSPGGIERRTVNDTILQEGVLVPERRTTRITIPPIVAKSLLFGVGQPAGAGASRLKCGLAGAIYFRLRTNPNKVPLLAADFAKDQLWDVLRTNWDRLHPCSSSAAIVTATSPRRVASAAKKTVRAQKKVEPRRPAGQRKSRGGTKRR